MEISEPPDYSPFLRRAITSCALVTKVPRQQRRTLMRDHDAQVRACEACTRQVLTAPSTRRLAAQGVAVLCDECAPEVLARRQSPTIIGFAPGAIDEMATAARVARGKDGDDA